MTDIKVTAKTKREVLAHRLVAALMRAMIFDPRTIQM